MNDQEHLLNTRQIAKFVADGFLRFDELIPRELCEEVVAHVKGDAKHNWQLKSGCFFSEQFPSPNPIGEVFRHPKVYGIIRSLVGNNPRYDHHAYHYIPPRVHLGQHLHQDSEIDIRPNTFDIQISFFPQDTDANMGGTRFLPGSHLRRVHEGEIGRYQNVLGQVQTVCKAGTIVVWHHNLWHSGSPNHSDIERYMLKLRLNPVVKQQLLWNTEDLNHEDIQRILMTRHEWIGQQHRISMIQRIKMWRHLTNNPDFDFTSWLHRIENNP